MVTATLLVVTYSLYTPTGGRGTSQKFGWDIKRTSLSPNPISDQLVFSLAY